MTNEELIVMARMADDLINNRRWLIEQRRFNDELMDRVKTAEEDSKKLMAECNRLRESEANALNAAEEAKRERDEARKKFGEWILFVESQVFVRLRAAKSKKNLRREVEETIASMVKFQDEHPTVIIEGRKAK